MPTDDYEQFVRRVWDRIEQRTGRRPFYLDATRLIAYCPACGDGTMTIRFVEHPRPSIVISSRAQAGGCSWGCSEAAVAEALFS